jgi:FixJ family two-component response regulator
VNSQTVFVIDDDDDFRESLVSLLTALGFATEDYATTSDFRAHVVSDRGGCLVLDVRMPGQNGIDFYWELLKSDRRLPVIFVTAHADVSTAVSAMKTGAIEFLEKPFRKDLLLELVNRAMIVDAQWRSAEQRFQRLDAAIGGLSATDLETLKHVIAGETNKAMAAKLFISERGVELRRQRLMQKLGVRSLAELLKLAVSHQVLEEVRGLRDRLS